MFGAGANAKIIGPFGVLIVMTRCCCGMPVIGEEARIPGCLIALLP